MANESARDQVELGASEPDSETGNTSVFDVVEPADRVLSEGERELIYALLCEPEAACGTDADAGMPVPVFKASSLRRRLAHATAKASAAKASAASDPALQTTPGQRILGLTVVSSTWAVEGSSLTWAALALNGSHEYAYAFPRFDVLAYDAQGELIGRGERTCFAVAPLGRLAASGAWDLGEAAGDVAKVVVVAQESGTSCRLPMDVGRALPYPVDDLKVRRRWRRGGLVVTGIVLNPSPRLQTIRVTVLLRAKGGGLLAGLTVFVPQVPALGEATFRIEYDGPGDDFSAAEAIAEPWGPEN